MDNIEIITFPNGIKWAIVDDNVLKDAFSNVSRYVNGTTGSYLFHADWLGSIRKILKVNHVASKSEYEKYKNLKKPKEKYKSYKQSYKPQPIQYPDKDTEMSRLSKTLDMVNIVGEEYQGQYDSERNRYKELNGEDYQGGFSGGM